MMTTSNKKAVAFTIFLLCNITANGETYIQRQYTEIEPLLHKQHLTKEDVAMLMKFKTSCENQIINEKKDIDHFAKVPLENEQKPLAKFTSEEFKKNFSSPLTFSDPLGILAGIECLRLAVSYGFFPITIPVTFFSSISKWQKNKKWRQFMIQGCKENIKLYEEYIKKVNTAIANTTYR
jgi:hypothetical protein